MPGSETLQVAVRVRPFNSREKKRGAKLIIDMNGATTTIRNPETKEVKPFQFDHSYWSHDGYTEGDDGLLLSQTPKFATQKDVFQDVGIQLLKNAFEQPMAARASALKQKKQSLESDVAYGQTGAGKSFSMVGYGANVGIVPLAFEELFSHIQEHTTEKEKFTVTISVVEIYSEAVYDLLSSKRSVAGLKVRENPTQGKFYIQGLTKVPVGSYEEIQARMDQGTANRTVAATKMNATSSRAHTLVTLAFNTQTVGDDGSSTTKSSEVNLIDLAGSERADSAGTTGQGLKEGAMINKSLSALGNVISALVSGKKAPFRDSVLTRLLQNSLGGNARTFMIAALSPADINYDETLSTLRYADRAKQIKTKAVVNENPTDKLIRELKEANEKMRAQLAAGGEAIQITPEQSEGMSEAEKTNMRSEMEAEIRAQLEANEQEVSQVDNSNFEEQLSKAKAEWEAERAAAQVATPNAEQARSKGASKRRKSEPHIINLHEDPSLSRVLVHFLARGENMVGKVEEKKRRRGKKGGAAAKAAEHAEEAAAAATVSIGLSGLSIDKLHASITVTENHRYSIDRAVPGSSAKIVVNGIPLAKKVDLQHNDRLLIGESNLFLFQDPAVLSKPGKKKLIDWEDAQHELLQKQGASSRSTGLEVISEESREQVAILLPMVNECNAIFQMLDLHHTVSIAVLSGPVAGLEPDVSDVRVKLKNLDTNNSLLMSRNSFFQRRFALQKKLALKEEQENERPGTAAPDHRAVLVEDLPAEETAEEMDPFHIEEQEVTVGCGSLFLSSLAYNLPYEDTIQILDYKGRAEGKLVIKVEPTSEKDNGVVVSDPRSRIGHSIQFKISIESAELAKPKFAAGIRLKFGSKFLNNGLENVTGFVAGPAYQFKKEWTFTIQKITKHTIQWMESGSLPILVRFVQRESDSRVTGKVDPTMIDSRRRKSMAQPLIQANAAKEDTDKIVATLRAALAGYDAGVISQSAMVDAFRSGLNGGGLPARQRGASAGGSGGVSGSGGGSGGDKSKGGAKSGACVIC